MKANVDKDTCIGCGICEGLCPKVFRMNQDGLAEAIEGPISNEDLGDAEEARDQCPVAAITID